MVIPFAIREMAFANGQGIVACLPFPVKLYSRSHSLKIPGGGQHSSHDFPAKKNKRIRNTMEEETARKKQAQAWGAALLVSAQNMGISAHSFTFMENGYGIDHQD